MKSSPREKKKTDSSTGNIQVDRTDRPITLLFGKAVCRRWIYNNTGHLLRVTTQPGGNNICIPDQNAAWVLCDGANMLRQTPNSPVTDPAA